MSGGSGTKAIDIVCPRCGASPGKHCSLAPLYHQVRINAAARKTREQNLQRRARNETTS